MSRNPYIAASRPASSFTRSSRSSKRGDFALGSSRATSAGLLGRSRSSATLGGAGLSSQLTSSTYSPASSSTYVPSSSWQRSSSSTRLGSRNPTSSSSNNNGDSSLPTKATTTTTGARSNYRDEQAKSDSPSSAQSSSRYNAASPSGGRQQDFQSSKRAPGTNLYRSTSSHQLGDADSSNQHQCRNESLEEETPYERDSSHLKNYQQSKLNQSATGQQLSSPFKSRSSLQSLGPDSVASGSNTDNTRRSNTSLDSSLTSATDLSYASTADDHQDDGARPIGDSIPSASARHLMSQDRQLLKSQSLEIGRHQQASAQADANSSSLLTSSMSVDRLLLRVESMGERDLRKSFKELVMENERLKQQLKGFDDKDKQRQQEWIRRERQMERKISELEEENKQLEQWKQEIQRLKEENSSLIRVVSKLTKQH